MSEKAPQYRSILIKQEKHTVETHRNNFQTHNIPTFSGPKTRREQSGLSQKTTRRPKEIKLHELLREFQSSSVPVYLPFNGLLAYYRISAASIDNVQHDAGGGA